MLPCVVRVELRLRQVRALKFCKRYMVAENDGISNFHITHLLSWLLGIMYLITEPTFVKKLSVEMT